MTTMGPLYRAILRLVPEPGDEGKGKAIGYTNGAITGSLLRQDTMQISFVNTGNPNRCCARGALPLHTPPDPSRGGTGGGLLPPPPWAPICTGCA